MLKINPHESLNLEIALLLFEIEFLPKMMAYHASEKLREILNFSDTDDSFLGIMKDKDNDPREVMGFMAGLMALALGINMKYYQSQGTSVRISSPTRIEYKLNGKKRGIQEVSDIVSYIVDHIKESKIEKDIKTPVDRLLDPEHIILQTFLSRFLSSKDG